MTKYLTRNYILWIVLWGITFVILYLAQSYNYLLFHTTVEVMSALPSLMIFIIVLYLWNYLKDNNFLSFIGISLFFIGIIDLVHAMAYKGMPIFVGFDSNLSTQLWITARYVQMVSFVIAAILINRTIHVNKIKIIIIYTVVVMVILWSIFGSEIFPDTFIEGTGLTRFKVNSEYIISIGLLLSGVIIWKKRERFTKIMVKLLLMSILFQIFSELSFSSYVNVYGFSNILGHYFKVIWVVLLYRAILGPAIESSRELLFRELVASEKSIAEEKEQLAVTLRSIGDGVITTDIEGNVLMMNRMAEKLTGWSQDEAMDMPITTVFNIIDESTRVPYENPIQKVLTTGGIIELPNHTLLISKDGSERAIADSGAPVRDKDSEIIGMVLVFRDMTEKQKLLSNMQRIDKLDSLGILAGGIAHDFNNLLGGIFGYIDMAKMAIEDNKSATKYLDKALSVFDRTKDLTQQLLTFSKGGVPKRRTGQIGHFIKDNTAFVLSGTNVNSAFIIADDLWLCDFDENQIGQVIDNMLINAMQAMPLGGTVTIVANNKYLSDEEAIPIPSGKYIEITIKDEGEGISHETLKSIFDPFFSTKQKGNGLGLATCYSIIQKHDGYIEVESEIGKGSSFHIYLPATENSKGIDDITIVRRHKGFGTILIIDDEDFIREILAKMLIRMGYQVLLSINGEEALEESALIKSQGGSIRAAIFDLTIPGGMGGKETIGGFKDIFPDTPVFVSSGFSEDPTIARPRDFGFTDSIRKPYKEIELGEMLEKYLNR
ncbi:MAG: ATP-binding protein [Vallitaleaceae bacterium]|jgi:PAS domain S-box-containing protein|nr:ATP-binding protein [Vallitaleaceae bacterium]